MQTMDEILSTKMESIGNFQSLELTKSIMKLLHPTLKSHSPEEYICVYLRTFALVQSSVSIPKLSIDELESLRSIGQRIFRRH